VTQIILRTAAILLTTMCFAGAVAAENFTPRPNYESQAIVISQLRVAQTTCSKTCGSDSCSRTCKAGEQCVTSCNPAGTVAYCECRP
jgi:hypothetical protein